MIFQNYTTETSSHLIALLKKRIVFFDGAMGTQLQNLKLDENKYRGERFQEHDHRLQGCHDVLCLTQPDRIRQIHRQYLEAGADIIETNSFTAQALSLMDYGLNNFCTEINLMAALIARQAIQAYQQDHPETYKFVAGSIGPSNRSLSVPQNLDATTHFQNTFPAFVDSYEQQIQGLVDGGVDILLLETIFDVLNLKAALIAINRICIPRNIHLPLIISVSLSDQSGRTLSGQSIEAFWTSVAFANPLAIGLNCSLGPEAMQPYLQEISQRADCFISCVPNAGMPNEMGEYDATPDDMASILADFATRGWLNVVGGCCGTTPAHIQAIVHTTGKSLPRQRRAMTTATEYSGLDTLRIDEHSNFVMIGERTNVTGSKKFARLIREKNYGEACSIARQQIEGGANIIDVCVDDALLDGTVVMPEFLQRLVLDPEIARCPIMIDSSHFAVLEAGLQCLQGKSIVNSLSLKHGEERFKDEARIVRSYGAAVVIMAVDKQGQATTATKKVEVLARAYRILVEDIGFEPYNIIFDPGVMAIGTGIEAHADYARAFIEATHILKQRFPQAKISGGISNLSFAFRSHNILRQALNAVFLYHAIRAGLDMGIVNAGHLMVYDDVPPQLKIIIEDLLFNRAPNSTERLLDWVQQTDQVKTPMASNLKPNWRKGSAVERLQYACIHGNIDHIKKDAEEALQRHDAMTLIEGPLMDAMQTVGDRFSQGKMFLPQVIKSAQAMKQTISYLQTHMSSSSHVMKAQTPTILLATVKGDMHDIGKNIVKLVLECSGFKAIDLGFNVPSHEIIRSAQNEGVDYIGLSALISPSLNEMSKVAADMQDHGLGIPLLIGGAASNRKHTALKIAPMYQGLTVNVADATQAVYTLRELQNPSKRHALGQKIRVQQKDVRQVHLDQNNNVLSYDQAQSHKPKWPWSSTDITKPQSLSSQCFVPIPLEEIVPLIDWSGFFHVFEFRGIFPKLLERANGSKAAQKLFHDAKVLLQTIVDNKWLQAKGLFQFFPAQTVGNKILLYSTEESKTALTSITTLRQQNCDPQDNCCYALADFVAPSQSSLTDYVGLFACSAGFGCEAIVKRFREEHNDYQAIMSQALADRLAEASAEWLQMKAQSFCNLASKGEKGQGIRPAPGYPSCPDHSDRKNIFNILEVQDRLQIQLTDALLMLPMASVCGYYFNHPQARYFSVGRITNDQIEDYAKQKNTTPSDILPWINTTI